MPESRRRKMDSTIGFRAMPDDNDLEAEVTQQRMQNQRPEGGRSLGKDTLENFMLALNIVCYLLIIYIFIYITLLCFRNDVVLFTFHPLCMTIGFFLVSISIMIHNKHNLLTQNMAFAKRLKWHWIMQAAGLICLTIGFSIIIINKNINDKPHFTSLHGIFGLITYISLIITFLLGYFTWIIKWLFRSQSKGTQLQIHITFSVISFSIAVADYILGLFSGWFTKNASILGKWLCIISVIILAMHILWRPSTRTLLNKCCRKK